jgi:uncharacterized protein (DUF1501 family)
MNMDTITRRKFLKLSGAAAAGAAAPVLNFEQIANAAQARPLPLGTPILIVVTLYGGNDGINTVVPYNDPIYYDLRPDISYQPDKVLQLNDQLGLNPAMVGIKTLWDQKKVAIIRGVGYPKPDHSHFTSMAIWQTGAPESRLNSGWLGRWVETQEVDPMLAISLGSVLPPLLAGEMRSGSALPLGGLVIPTGTLAISCQKLARVASSDNKLMAAAATSMRTLFNVSSTITPILKMPVPVSEELPTANGGNAGGDSNLAQQLDVVAKLIAAGSPTRVWSVSLGGFDTHANEANTQAKLLGTVSEALTRFTSQMKNTNRGKDIVTMVYSEFGRRVKGNASQGTDHGTSGPVFLFGDRVKGGFYGDQPSLSKLVNGDLAVTTDFRDIYAAVLEDVLKTPTEKIISGWKSKGKYF